MSNHSKYPTKAGVYKLTCNSNGKVYIGKAVNLQKRLNVHKNCKKTSTQKFHLQNALLKYGWDSFTVEILEIVENFDKVNDNSALLEREAYYIELFDSTNEDIGYNLCKYSKDTTGIPLTEEHKEKLRQAKLGKSMHPNTRESLRESHLGKHRSEETKEKIRQGKLGKTFSDEHKENLRKSHLGKKLSEENIERLRQINTGRKHSEESKEKMRKAKKKSSKLKPE